MFSFREVVLVHYCIRCARGMKPHGDVLVNIVPTAVIEDVFRNLWCLREASQHFHNRRTTFFFKHEKIHVESTMERFVVKNALGNNKTGENFECRLFDSARVERAVRARTTKDDNTDGCRFSYAVYTIRERGQPRFPHARLRTELWFKTFGRDLQNNNKYYIMCNSFRCVTDILYVRNS